MNEHKAMLLIDASHSLLTFCMYDFEAISYLQYLTLLLLVEADSAEI